jgi:hypothetical protein
LIVQDFRDILSCTMAEAEDEKHSATDENPGDAPTAVQADRNDKQGDSGCFILFLAMVVIDAVGAHIPLAGPYSQVVFVLGLVGFTCGGGIGAYVSIRIMKRRWWSSGWWMIGGLLGLCLFVYVAIYISFIMLRTR